MPSLLKEHVVSDNDGLASAILNPGNTSDILTTMPALNAHSKSAEDIAYTIDHYFKRLNKKTIYFSDYKEAPNPTFLFLLKQTIDILISRYMFSYDQMVYTSGFLPTKDNFEKIKKLCSSFDLPNIAHKNVFYFEEEWKKVMNTCELWPNFFDLRPLHSRNLRSKKFLFFMGAPRPHRIAILSFLINQTYIKDAYYSCLSSKDAIISAIHGCIHHEKRNTQFNFKNVKATITNFNENFPKELSSKVGDEPGQHSASENDIFYFADSYYSIIPETSYFKKDDDKDTIDQWNYHLDFTFITEKTMRAIGYLHPFVLLSRPYSLKGLRELGYQTFHPYIDESYDLIEDDHLRFESIKNTIKKLNNKTESEWIRFQHDIYPMVKHNHDWLRSEKHRRVSYNPSTI